MDLDDLLGQFDAQAEPEDRTVYIRSTPRGDKVSFTVVERTSFRHGYPETTKELHSEFLDCGHLLTQENNAAGFCAGHRLFRRCNREYCARCVVQCPRCGISVSARCCARGFQGYLLCKKCARLLKCFALGATLGRMLLQPFLSEESFDERQERLAREREQELLEQRRRERELEWEQRRQREAWPD